MAHVRHLGKTGMKDVHLFAHIAALGYKVHITLDHHYRKPVEREAIAKAGLIVFVLNKGWASQPLHEKAARLLRWWPLIVEQASRLTPPATLRVPWQLHGRGKFEIIRNV